MGKTKLMSSRRKESEIKIQVDEEELEWIEKYKYKYFGRIFKGMEKEQKA